jgi:hypothetical protein
MNRARRTSRELEACSRVGYRRINATSAPSIMQCTSMVSMLSSSTRLKKKAKCCVTENETAKRRPCHRHRPVEHPPQLTQNCGDAQQHSSRDQPWRISRTIKCNHQASFDHEESPRVLRCPRKCRASPWTSTTKLTRELGFCNRVWCNQQVSCKVHHPHQHSLSPAP